MAAANDFDLVYTFVKQEQDSDNEDYTPSKKSRKISNFFTSQTSGVVASSSMNCSNSTDFCFACTICPFKTTRSDVYRIHERRHAVAQRATGNPIPIRNTYNEAKELSVPAGHRHSPRLKAQGVKVEASNFNSSDSSSEADGNDESDWEDIPEPSQAAASSSKKCLKASVDGRYFSFVDYKKSTDGIPKIILCKCNFCGEVKSAHVTSDSNLYGHMRKRHFSKAEAFQKYVKENSHKSKLNIRKLRRQYENSQQSRVSIEFNPVKINEKSEFDPPSSLTQSVLDLLVNRMCNLAVIETDPVEDFFKDVFPSYEVPKTDDLKNMLRTKHVRNLELFKRLFALVPFVCTTTDIWTIDERSYIGMTCHWITKDFKRKSVALGFRRIAGNHNYCLIGKVIHQLLTDVGVITSKIDCTITDNNVNFLRSFPMFPARLLEHLGLNSGDDYVEDDREPTVMANCQVSEILGEVGTFVELPPIQTYSSHEFSLIAGRDCDAALDNPVYSRGFNSAMGKVYSVCNEQNQCPDIADAVYNIANKLIPTPGFPGYNGLFDSVQVFLDLELNLEDICKAANTDVFSMADVTFLKDWSALMRPLTLAIQDMEKGNLFLGELVGCVRLALHRLTTAREQLGHKTQMMPLADAIENAVQKRFHFILEYTNIDGSVKDESKKYMLAVLTLPTLKNRWEKNRMKKDTLRRLLIDIMKYSTESTVNRETMAPVQAPQSNVYASLLDDEEEYFFEDQVEKEADNYLNCRDQDLESLHKFPTVKKLFFTYNTAIPSGAAVEKLLGSAGHLDLPKKQRIDDDLLEWMLMTKVNDTSDLEAQLSELTK